MSNKFTNPFGNFGDSLKPRRPKHVGQKHKAIISVSLAPQDTQEFADRCHKMESNLNAIKKHFESNGDVKFIKRNFFLKCVEHGIEEFMNKHNIQSK